MPKKKTEKKGKITTETTVDKFQVGRFEGEYDYSKSRVIMSFRDCQLFYTRGLFVKSKSLMVGKPPMYNTRVLFKYDKKITNELREFLSKGAYLLGGSENTCSEGIEDMFVGKMATIKSSENLKEETLERHSELKDKLIMNLKAEIQPKIVNNKNEIVNSITEIGDFSKTSIAVAMRLGRSNTYKSEFLVIRLLAVKVLKNEQLSEEERQSFRKDAQQAEVSNFDVTEL